jgi:hypothetical protein
VRDEWKVALQTHVLKLRQHLRTNNTTSMSEFYKSTSHLKVEEIEEEEVMNEKGEDSAEIRWEYNILHHPSGCI